VKGDSIPWVVQVEGKRVGGLELVVSLTVERGTLASLRDHHLLWIHSPSSGCLVVENWNNKAMVGRNMLSSAVGCTFYKISVLICCVYSC
jgi:hypothetical protein